jgi:glycerol-3-phosphate dehydrogenase (NAD(P)+)
MQSRNFSLGYALGEGKSLDHILKSRTSITEGIPTTEALAKLATQRKIDMPIVTALQSCLSGAMDIDTAIHTLMSRPLQAEFQ